MALGMTKDSMVDLQSMLEEKENDNKEDDAVDTVSLLTTGQSNGSKVEYNKLVSGGGGAAAADKQEEDHPPSVVETEEVAQKRLSAVGGESSSDTSDARLASAPQEAQDSSSTEGEKKPAGQYAGFATDYDAYDYDPYQIHYDNTPQTLLGGQKPSSGGFLCCVFPWLYMAGNANSRIKEQEESTTTATPEEKSAPEKTKTSDGPVRKLSAIGEDDDASTGEVSAAGSDNLGEKLSEKDRQAVLARLRLAQPDGSLNSPGRTSGSSDAAGGSPGSPGNEKPPQNQKGLLSDIPNLPLQGDDSQSDLSTGSIPKGILKRQAFVKTPEPLKNDPKSGKRRSLFPMYETSQPSKKNDNNVHFSPMARVVTIKSQKEMSAEEKSHVWWQRWDYEDFRKTGRIITRAMLEGGSEIWLASNQSWQHLGASKSATLKHAMTLAERGATKNGETPDLIRSTGDKWWHKFGHSRRGLEHIASIKEGTERQANVRHAIRAMLDEQRRQKTYFREDPEKLRMVCIHNTSWARDLALAAGQSDADAVNRKFDEERKSREFYLLKMVRSNSVTSQGKHVPAFMKPAMTSFTAPKLDANTSAQIMYRRKQHRQQLSLSSSASSSKKKDTSGTPPVRSMEPIHDPTKHELDLARRAAGFSHDGAEPVNMAAVLSGMGAIPKIAVT